MGKRMFGNKGYYCLKSALILLKNDENIIESTAA